MALDPGRVLLLLDIVHKAATAGPTYSWIVSLADAELTAMRTMHDETIAFEKSKVDRAAQVTPAGITTLVNEPI